jgi:hypothetical protein
MSDEIVQPVTGGLSATIDKSGKISPAGKIAMDPTQTEAILSKMQEYIDERSGPMNTFLGGLNKARAVLAGPSALTAYQQQENVQDKQIMDYRTQMAAYRAAQKQAQNDATRLSGLTGGGTGGGGAGGPGALANLTPEARMRVDNARNATEALAIIDEDLKAQAAARAKGQFEAAGNKSEKYFWPGKGWVDMTPNMLINMPPELKRQLEQATFKQLGYIPGQQKTEAAVPSDTANVPSAAAPAAAPQPGKAVEIARSLNIPIISGDRSQDKQNELYIASKQPGYKGPPVAPPGKSQHQFGNAIDVGPITEEQRAQLRSAGFTQPHANDPNHWELSGAKTVITPAQTAVNKLDMPVPDNFPVQEGEWNQAKAAAAPSAPVMPPKPPQAAPAAPAAAKPTTPPPPVGTAPLMGSGNAITDVPAFNEPRPNAANFSSSSEAEKANADWEKRRDAALEIYKKFQEQTGAKSAESFADAEKAFVTNTDQTALSRRETNTNQLDAWMKRHGENPRILEILSKPEFSNAVADALSQGITTPIGGVNIPGIARLVQAGMPGLKQQDVVALKQLDAIMGPRLFEIVRQSKGSSSDKDWAAYTQIAGNANTGYDFLNKAIKYDRISLKADKEDRALYNSTLKPGQPSDYRGFASDPRRNQIYDQYNSEVQRIAAMQHERQQVPPRPAGMPKDTPPKWSPSTQSFWIGNTEYKVK